MEQRTSLGPQRLRFHRVEGRGPWGSRVGWETVVRGLYPGVPDFCVRDLSRCRGVDPESDPRRERCPWNLLYGKDSDKGVNILSPLV